MEEKNGFSIYHILHIRSSLKKVFDAISFPEHLDNWWPKTCSGRPQVGSVYRFYFSPEYDWFGKVVKLETDRSFHIKMTKADVDWTPTTFGFDLEPAENGVLLHFFHGGWPECNAHFKRSSYCWAILLSGLKNYVENGTVIPFEDRE